MHNGNVWIGICHMGHQGRQTSVALGWPWRSTPISDTTGCGCRVSTVVVQRFCKPKVGGSNPSPGTSDFETVDVDRMHSQRQDCMSCFRAQNGTHPGQADRVRNPPARHGFHAWIVVRPPPLRRRRHGIGLVQDPSGVLGLMPSVFLPKQRPLIYSTRHRWARKKAISAGEPLVIVSRSSSRMVTTAIASLRLYVPLVRTQGFPPAPLAPPPASMCLSDKHRHCKKRSGSSSQRDQSRSPGYP